MPHQLPVGVFHEVALFIDRVKVGDDRQTRIAFPKLLARNCHVRNDSMARPAIAGLTGSCLAAMLSCADEKVRFHTLNPWGFAL